MSRYITTRTSCRFTTKEGTNDRYLLVLEPYESLSVLADGQLTIELKPGTTIDDAQLLAGALNGQVAALAFTGPAHAGDPDNLQ